VTVQFLVPGEAWVTDITHIRAYEGWLYFVVAVDLFSNGYWLVDAITDYQRYCFGCIANGYAATKFETTVRVTPIRVVNIPVMTGKFSLKVRA